MKAYYYYLKIFVAVSLLAILFVKIDVVESLSFLLRLHYTTIAAIFIVTFWLIFFSVLKWQIFLQSLDLTHPFWRLYQYYIVGYFFNNFMPSSIGGDTVRFSLTANGKNYSSSFVAVFMERFTGLIALLIFVSVSIPFSLLYFDYFQNMLLFIFPVFLIFFLLTIFLLIQPDIFKFESKHKLLNNILLRLKGIMLLIYSFRNKKEVFLKAMVLSILFNILTIFNVYVVGIALNLQVNFFELFILVPMILLITNIPLSINAIGIAEGSYVMFLGLVGLSAPEALSIALLMRAKTLIVSILGGIFFLGYRKRDSLEFIHKSKKSTKDVVS